MHDPADMGRRASESSITSSSPNPSGAVIRRIWCSGWAFL